MTQWDVILLGVTGQRSRYISHLERARDKVPVETGLGVDFHFGALDSSCSLSRRQQDTDARGWMNNRRSFSPRRVPSFSLRVSIRANGRSTGAYLVRCSPPAKHVILYNSLI